MFDDCDILVLALDSLAVRKQVIETCKDTQFILDTRMLGKVSEIYTLYGIQRQHWLDNQRKENADAENEGTRCTEKAIAFVLENAKIKTGADEIPLSLISRALSKNQTIKINPGCIVAFEESIKYSITPAGNFTTMLFGTKTESMEISLFSSSSRRQNPRRNLESKVSPFCSSQ